MTSLIDQHLEQYALLLKEYSRKINVISKKITSDQLKSLISESLLVAEHIKGSHIVDAGSGNGILGIPIALLFPERNFFLVEPRKKKSEFLHYAVDKLNIKNTEVLRSDIEGFVKGRNCLTIVARGFPDNEKLTNYLRNHIAREVILITSPSKIKKIEKGIEKYEQRIYNVPFRDNLKIICLSNVSRET